MSKLTPRELEVARLVAQGLTSVQICKKLGTSVDTVKRQTITICDKLHITGPEKDPERKGYRRLLLAIHMNQGDEVELRKEVKRLRERLRKYEPSVDSLP